jgi:hypothetical protein
MVIVAPKANLAKRPASVAIVSGEPVAHGIDTNIVKVTKI